MKIRLGTVSNGAEAISKLANMDMGEPILNFRLMTAVDVIDDNLRKYQRVCQKAFEKYSTKESEGAFNVPLDKIKALNEEVDKAADIEIEIDWEPIEVDISALKGFTAKDMKMLIGTFIKLKGE